MNKPLEELDKNFIKENVKAVAFDLDGVIVETGTFLKQSIDGSELMIKTNKLSKRMEEMLNELKKYVRIIFVSGRSVLHLETMVEGILWDKVSLIGENGNFLLTDGKLEQLALYENSYFEKLNNIRKELKKLKEKNPEIVCGFEPKHMIITIHTSEKVPEVEEIVKFYDKEGELYCLWTSEGYDIGSKRTNKKTALKTFLKSINISEREIITTGNNLNDKEMLELGIGISVNPELVSGEYAVSKKKSVLGGEVIAEYLLEAFK
jgi:HAD superfamily hydrolase (TIGR01484 family)